MESTNGEALIARVMSKKGWSRAKAIEWLEKTFGKGWQTRSLSRVDWMLLPISKRFKYQFETSGDGPGYQQER